MTTILVGSDAGLHRLGEDQERQLDGRAVTALSVEGGGHAVVDGAVWRLGAAGDWELLRRPPSWELTCLLVSSAAGLLAGTDGAHLLGGEKLEPVESFEAVDGREEWYTPWGGPPATRSLTEDADGNLYVNVHVGGIVGSTDGGKTWVATGMDIHADAHQVLAPGGAGRVLAACAAGLGISDDAGKSWTYETEGLHGTYQRAVAVAGDTVVVSASEGHMGRRSALYRRPLDGDPGEPFERCRTGLPDFFGSNIDTACLAASGSTVAFGTRDGTVYLSDDAGANWELVAEGLRPVRCLALV
jgi:hypothetical protein